MKQDFDTLRQLATEIHCNIVTDGMSPDAVIHWLFDGDGGLSWGIETQDYDDEDKALLTRYLTELREEEQQWTNDKK